MIKFIGVGLLLGMVSLPGFASSWDGVVDWAQRIDMGTALSGVVAKVAVKEGDRVKKGELLLQLEQGALQARLAQRVAEMKYKKLMREEARKELERAEELYARTLLADHDLDLAKIAYAEADAAYQTTRADHRQAKETLDNSSLRAPYDAVVLARNIRAAQTVISRCEAQPLLTLATTTQMRVRIFVESTKLESLRSNDGVTVEVAGQRYPGELSAVGYEPEIVNESARYPVDVLFNSGDLMLIGQAAKVSEP